MRGVDYVVKNCNYQAELWNTEGMGTIVLKCSKPLVSVHFTVVSSTPSSYSYSTTYLRKMQSGHVNNSCFSVVEFSFPLYQRTPLQMAARRGHVEVVRYLGDEIDDINIIKDKDGVRVCECRGVCLVQYCSCPQMCSHTYSQSLTLSA